MKLLVLIPILFLSACFSDDPNLKPVYGKTLVFLQIAELIFRLRLMSGAEVLTIQKLQ